MYVITMTGWITIPERASLAPFLLEIALASSHKTHMLIYESTVSSFLPAAGINTI